jgi:hypothetical protein
MRSKYMRSLFICLTFLFVSLSVYANNSMEKPRGVGEVTQSLNNIDGTSPCADRNNDGVADCQQHLGKRPGTNGGIKDDKPAGAVRK